MDGLSMYFSEKEQPKLTDVFFKPSSYDGRVTIRIEWFDDTEYWGEIRILQDGDELEIDSENMSKEFVKNVLCFLVDKSKIV